MHGVIADGVVKGDSNRGENEDGDAPSALTIVPSPMQAADSTANRWDIADTGDRKQTDLTKFLCAQRRPVSANAY